MKKIPAPIGKAARNERRKLRATTVNALGLAVAAVGVIQPAINSVFSPELLLKLAFCGIIAYLFHQAARVELATIED
jgi:hypothetical protein